VVTRIWSFVAGAAVVLGVVRTARAQGENCGQSLSRANIVDCALQGSPDLKFEQQTTEAFRGRQTGARAWLPSNPTVTLSGARRTAAADSQKAYNWYASVSQELELSGARGARIDAAAGHVAAQEQRVLATRRDVAARAWASYFDAVAAQENLRLAQMLSGVAGSIAVVARARADQGLSSPLEADVAEASSMSFLQQRFAAERALSVARAELAVLVGLEPGVAPAVQGDLTPIAGAEAAAQRLLGLGAAAQPEVRASGAEQRALQRQADAYRRSRVPNPSVSVFAQNDGFNERVLGLGLSFPIPLPNPVGQTRAGEIAESEALSRRAGGESVRIERQLRLAAAAALLELESHRRELEAFSPERTQRARDALQTIARELQAGRLNVRDALASEQALVQLLQAQLAARHALASASVTLARAAGMALEGGRP
jgi:outer membrane protein, heavy metal efflux system